MKNPTIQQLIDTIKEYNRAWEIESSGPKVPRGQDPYMDNLYAAATVAAKDLQCALTLEVRVRPAPKK